MDGDAGEHAYDANYGYGVNKDYASAMMNVLIMILRMVLLMMLFFFVVILLIAIKRATAPSMTMKMKAKKTDETVIEICRDLWVW